MASFTRVLTGAALAASVSVLAFAKQPQPPIFKGAAGATVSTFATVSDADRRLVPNLPKEDFEILDNEKPQTITVFDNRPQPITVVVMLDTSGSMTNSS
jgi:hypothetical protein